MPTYALWFRGILAVPMLVQVAPSGDMNAATIEPWRRSRTQYGAELPDAMVRDVEPPLVVRRWNPTPFDADTNANACAAFASRLARIMTPAFDQFVAGVT